MDIVKNQLARIQQQLSGLTPSQKMLTAALVAIMVVTLLYWGRHAGTAEMEPVLDQPIAQNDIAPMKARLKSLGIDAVVQGDRLLVPSDRVYEAVAELAYSGTLPQDSETGFDQMVAKLSPWASASERDALQNRGKEITCAQIIRLFPGVQQAQVMIDPTSKGSIGKRIEPSASVNITMREGAGSARKVAEAAAAVVSGAQASLTPGRINVVVNGNPQPIRAPGGAGDLGGSEEQLENLLWHKKLYEENILSVLPPIDDLRVAVSIKLNRDRVTTDQQLIDKENSLSKIRSEKREESETQDPAPAQEPGAMPNVGGANTGMEIPFAGSGAGGSPGGGTKMTKDESEFDNFAGYTKTHTEHGMGDAKVVSASVRVPRSYFSTIWKQRNPDKPIDSAAVEALAQEQINEFERLVRGSVGMDEKAMVVVSAFDDIIQLQPLAPPEIATASIPLMIGNHSKEIALGGLALVSLFMVSMFVRRSAPVVPPPAATGVTSGGSGGVVSQLLSGEAVAGEAGDGKAMLDGMELDEESVRTQQMLDQVSTLVSDNPDAAASLVKRWLNRD